MYEEGGSAGRNKRQIFETPQAGVGGWAAVHGVSPTNDRLCEGQQRRPSTRSRRNSAFDSFVPAWQPGKMKRLPLLILTLLGSCGVAAAAEPPVCGYQIRRTYPHDPQAFTQGLLYRDGFLFESTGLEGRSTIRKVRLENGTVVKRIALPPSLFGEGIADWGDEILSLTWRHGTGFRWNIGTFQRTGQFSYRGEGWGLTQDGKNVILSDGSAKLRFLDPLTMRERRSVTVSTDGKPVLNLNELEWVGGEILANVWQTDRIARIDPVSGNVKAWIDLSGLRRLVGAHRSDDVLNGIAYDREGGRLFVTGKNWPKLFEVTLVNGTENSSTSPPCPSLGTTKRTHR